MVWPKSVGSAPLKAIPEMFSTSFPLFVSVTFWVGLALRTCWVVKVNELGVRSAVAAVPNPKRAAVCVPPGASSVNVMFAEFEPVAVGLKITLTVQFPPAGTLVPQVFV